MYVAHASGSRPYFPTLSSSAGPQLFSSGSVNLLGPTSTSVSRTIHKSISTSAPASDIGYPASHISLCATTYSVMTSGMLHASSGIASTSVYPQSLSHISRIAYLSCSYRPPDTASFQPASQVSTGSTPSVKTSSSSISYLTIPSGTRTSASNLVYMHCFASFPCILDIIRTPIPFFGHCCHFALAEPVWCRRIASYLLVKLQPFLFF